MEELEKYGDVLKESDGVTLARVGTNDWKFLYTTTQLGKVIGTRECYERTQKAMRRMGCD